VCKFLPSPTEDHWVVVKRILRYIHHTCVHGLLLRTSSSGILSAYSDVDWDGDVEDMRSTGWFALFHRKKLGRVECSKTRYCTVVKL
jgi:hypothetical protein